MVEWKTHRRLIFLGSAFFLIAVLSGITFHYRPAPQSQVWNHPWTVIDDGRADLRQSRLVGGVPGYFVFDNVWYQGGVFYHNDVNLELASDMVVSDPAKFQFGNLSAVDIHLDETTLLIGEAGEQYMWHYYHFSSEDILGGLASLAGSSNGFKRQELPKRLIIPWESAWKDIWHLNTMMVKGLFDDRVVDNEEWGSMTAGDRTIFFSRIVIVDRWASHRHNQAVQVWNKMALSALDVPKLPHFFQPVRQRLLDSLNIRPRTRVIPMIVYVDRQDSNRRLRDQDHAALLQLGRDLQDAGIIEWEQAQWETMSGEDQIRMVSDAAVMIGIHGQGLSHQLWMPEEATLIELFPEDAYIREYQSVARALGHPYYAVANDNVLSQEDWMYNKGERNPNKLHDGTEIPLHVPFIQRLLEIILAT